MQGIDKVSNRTLGITGFILLIIIIAYYFKKKKNNEQTAQMQFLLGVGGDSKSTDIAVRLKKAINLTSDYEFWFGDPLNAVTSLFEDSDQKAILEISKEIANIEAVIQAYQTLYNRNLFKDLEEALNAENLLKFKDNIQRMNKLDSANKKYIGKKVNLYSSRSLYYDADLKKKVGNIIPKGQFHIVQVAMKNGVIVAYKFHIVDKNAKVKVARPYWVTATTTDKIL